MAEQYAVNDIIFELLDPEESIIYNSNEKLENSCPKSGTSSPTFEIQTIENAPIPDDLFLLLKEWNLTQLYENMKAENITIEVLKVIRLRHLEILMRKHDLGTKILFENHLEVWRKSVGASSLYLYPEYFKIDSCHSNLSSCSSSPPTSPTTHKTFSAPSSPEPGIESTPTVACILNATVKGQKLSEYYSSAKSFKEEHRNMLISIIVEYFDDRSIHMSLKDTYILEQQILEIFPTEKLNFYRTSKRGKIYNKFFNKRITKKMFKKNSNLEAVEEKDENVEQILVPEEDAENIIRSIKHDNLSVMELDQFWKACSKHRLQYIKNSSSTADILEKWPQYKLPTGYRLIDIDFNVLYPKCATILHSWEATENAFVDVLLNDGLINNKDIKQLLSEFGILSQNSKEAVLL